MSAAEALLVVAVVMVNDSEALVLNRPIRFSYERVGQDFLGSDGPLRDFLYYERGGGSFKAFAGRELSLQMADGSVEKLKDHWWSGTPKGCRDVIVGDVEALRACYVFSSAQIEREAYAALRGTYTGCVYPYRDYEKVIKFDAMRKDLYDRLFAEEKRRKELEAELARHKEVRLTRSERIKAQWAAQRAAEAA